MNRDLVAASTKKAFQKPGGGDGKALYPWGLPTAGFPYPSVCTGDVLRMKVNYAICKTFKYLLGG